MMAYAHLYGASRLTLLYPHHVELSGLDGIQQKFWIGDRQVTALETASIDVAYGTDDDIVGRLKKIVVPSFAERQSDPVEA